MRHLFFWAALQSVEESIARQITTLTDLRSLMRRYRDRPMSLADACLVRMSERYSGAKVFTLDSDFQIYRRHGNKKIPLLMRET